jgi:REP element-mobilizing transposase RayT
MRTNVRLLLYNVVMRSPDPQLEMTFRTWGGKRRGAGRPQVHRRCSEPHREREAFPASSPVHVTLRLTDEVSALVGTLRARGLYHVVRVALEAVFERPDFRIVHASIQANHLHLLIEATSKDALAAGAHAFQISLARRLKHYLASTSGMHHDGPVFVDRYHVEIIDSPTQARNALAYVLLNWRKHGEDRPNAASSWLVDPYSTAIGFEGWSDHPFAWPIPDGYQPLPCHGPTTWLLRKGWLRAGTISLRDVPSPGRR